MQTYGEKVQGTKGVRANRAQPARPLLPPPELPGINLEEAMQGMQARLPSIMPLPAPLRPSVNALQRRTAAPQIALPMDALSPPAPASDAASKKRRLDAETEQDKQKLENPFTLNTRREELLKLFLVTTRPSWNPPVPAFRARQGNEDLYHYVEARKAYYNRLPPKIANITHLFIPSIMRRSNSQHMLLVSLAPSHLQILNHLFQWHHASGWKGMMALFPWPSMECTRYDFNLPNDETAFPRNGNQTSIHPSASVLEAHRRAIELERVTHDLTEYLCRSMSKTDCMQGFPERHLKLAFTAISAGGGLFGSGKDFWTPAPCSLQATERLIACFGNANVASALTDATLWLNRNRQAAFTRVYTVATELDWGIPLLGLCFQQQATLAHLDEEGKAQGMLRTLEDELHERTNLYIKDLEPLLAYGGHLTLYVKELHALCMEHFSILSKIPGNRHKLTFPSNCKLLSINHEGKLIGPDGQPSSAGHFSLPEVSLADGMNRPPLPFPEACCAIQHDAIGLQSLVEARHNKEERLLKGMLTSLFGNADETNTISVMRRGYKNALKRLRDDSHQSRLTAVFPPTASMPSAEYQPDVLFK